MKGVFSLFWGILFSFNVSFAGAIVVPVDPADATAHIKDETAAKNANALAVIAQNKNAINRAARNRGVDPVLVAASIAAEHALNYDIYDRMQNLMGEQLSRSANIWAQTNVDHPEKNLSLLIEDPSYADCFSRSDSYNKWFCVVQKWNNRDFSLSFKAEKRFFLDFTTNFFDPNAHSDIGLSFGIGQMSPVRALMMDDRVGSQAINFERHHDVTVVFQKILDPNTVPYFIAATNKYAMSVYASKGYDISQNPGIVATLYNLGNEWYYLGRTSRAGRLPETNDFGKWVNKHIDEIRAAIR